MKHRLITVMAIVASLTAITSASAGDDRRGERRDSPGAVYTMSNGSTGNAILVFDRLADGRLVPGETVPTGGVRPISVTEHRGVVYVAHAGSDNIAGFTLGLRADLRPLADLAVGRDGRPTDRRVNDSSGRTPSPLVPNPDEFRRITPSRSSQTAVLE